jgi:hypothetical protein
LEFSGWGERFKLIEKSTTPIIIQYDEAVKARLKDTAHHGIWSKDRAFLQLYIISLPTKVFNKLQDKEQGKLGLDLWKWTGHHNPI